MKAKWTDHRGVEIKKGQKVAYNFSGEVAYGEVTGVTTGKKYGRDYPRISVVQIAPLMGHQSTVTNSKNLLVIPELEVGYGVA